MKFRWKLLVLLLALSILPIVGLRAFGIHNVHQMADALTARIEKSQMDDAAIPYRESSTAIEDGQVLFIGTDGIWETGNKVGELFGKDRLKEVIRQHADQSARDILLAVHAAAEEFRGELKQEDDLTIVVVKLIAK